MAVKQAYYEEVLADCSNHLGAIALLKQHRPYLEMIPSMRRPDESVIAIPLPLVRLRQTSRETASDAQGLCRLPADVAILMCDPEWQIKTGVEVFVFIHQPQEDFSQLLGRWRQTQIWVDRGYQWLMPDRYQHLLSEGADEPHPLFIIFPETPKRIQRGLRAAALPFVVRSVQPPDDELTVDPAFPSGKLMAED